MNPKGGQPLRADLRSVADRAADFLESLSDRHVSGTATPVDLQRALDRPLPEEGTHADVVIDELALDVERGLVASVGPRYFGFVVGGVTRAGLMADWLTSTWDQNAQVYATSPAAAAVEAVVARWVVEILGLPAQSSVGFVTGCQMANFTALSVARNTVLERSGWNVDDRGLFGAPPLRIFMSDCGHATILSAARMMGVGSDQICTIPSDGEGRMNLDSLKTEIERATGQPMILSLQAGNVNTGAFESVAAVADLVQGENAWIHVDGAFGLWAAMSPKLRGNLEGTPHGDRLGGLHGLERADSWSTDAHKWLNVPYDSGLVIVKDAAQHQRLKTSRCAYVGEESSARRDGSSWVPENSRRARAFVLYAVLRELGRAGVCEIVERSCHLAQVFAQRVVRISGVEVRNDVVLNQVLVRLEPPEGWDAADFHAAVAAAVQSEGRCWLGSTIWKEQPVLRVSICNSSTTEDDVGVLLEALRGALESVPNPG